MAEVAVTRRDFLLSAAGAAAAALPVRARAQAPPVVIVGAGIAGLRAADRLLAAGQRVVVLEGRRRPGGRVLTLRAPLSEGLYGDAGPIRIPTEHRRLLEIIARFDLPLVPFASGSGDTVVVARGVRVRLNEMERIADALGVPAPDRGLAQGELLARYVGDLPASLADPDIAFDSSWRAFDGLTWPAWLRSRGASDGSVALMTLGGDSRELSALYVLRQYSLLQEGGLYKIEGGMDRIARAMAGTVSSTIQYGAHVTRIDPTNADVSVEYVQDGRRRSVSASRVIVTVPAPLLPRIETASSELRERAELAGSIPYFPATRFLVETTTRSWHDMDLSGSARTDRPAEIWETAYEAEGDSGVLGATVGGALGATLARGPRAAAVQMGIDVVKQAFPSIKVRTATVYRWAADPWAQGAFATFRPGQMTRILPAASKPVGRVHFAGEHTSPWMGWIEGALESADRAAKEVLS